MASSLSQGDPGPSPCCVQLQPRIVSHTPPGANRMEQNQRSKTIPRALGAEKGPSVRTSRYRAADCRVKSAAPQAGNSSYPGPTLFDRES